MEGGFGYLGLHLSSNFDWYAWVILPLLIFAARVCDVTLGTMRIIFVSRGKRNLAPFLGFVEVFIWIAIVGQIIKQAVSLPSYIGYASGFAAGNFVGMYIEDRLALGTLIVRAILQRNAEAVIANLHSAGYGVTKVDGQGTAGPVQIIYTIIKRKDLATVKKIIHQNAPSAFLTIEEVRSAEAGIFPKSVKNQTSLFGRKSK